MDLQPARSGLRLHDPVLLKKILHGRIEDAWQTGNSILLRMVLKPDAAANIPWVLTFTISSERYWYWLLPIIWQQRGVTHALRPSIPELVLVNAESQQRFMNLLVRGISLREVWLSA